MIVLLRWSKLAINVQQFNPDVLKEIQKGNLFMIVNTSNYFKVMLFIEKWPPNL